MIIDGTNGLTFNNATTQASAGVVLQVVSGVYSTQVSTTSSTLADTGLTLTITPKFSTSKILVLVSQNIFSSSSSGGQIAINRAGTDVINFADGTPYGPGQSSLVYLDSPATTSATIYKTRFARLTGAGTIYAQLLDASVGQGYSTITLMEIAG
jgi:hypothetical protein